MGYLYLLASAWQTDDCTISDDPLDLASMSGLGDDLWAQYCPRILRKFQCDEIGGRLYNPVLREEWSEAKRIFEARSAAARKTTETRSPSKKSTVTVGKSNGHRTVSERRPSRSADTITGTGTETPTETRASTLAVTSSEVPAGVFELPLPGEQGEWSVPQGLFDELVKLYPDVSVMEQLAKMRAWLLTNPRKTAKGLPRFMNNWLSRAQNNSPRTSGGNNHAKPNRIDAILESTNATLAARRSGGMDSQADSDRGGAHPITTARSLFERPHAQLVAKNPG
jgi:uncharacterized protein YdaU (DUF1376 family)